LGKSYFKTGNNILVSALEHHANIVPYQHIAQRHDIQVMPVDANGVLKLEESLQLISSVKKVV
jgi:selenocysteine lyase/cysteine desulfurase